MNSRDTTLAPLKSTINSNKKIVFNPIIIFNNEPSSPEYNPTNEKKKLSNQEKIEKHRIKVKSMLETNVKLWESSWFYRHYDLDPISSGTVYRKLSIVIAENVFEFTQEESDKKMDLQVIHNLDSLGDGANDSVRNPIKTITLSPQPKSSATAHLTSNNHNVMVQSDYEIDKGKKQRVAEPISNALRFKLDLKHSQYLYQNEPQESTRFVPGILETDDYNPSNKKRKRENIPKEITEHLKEWLIQHKKHPYPTEIEKQKLAEETGLMINQISNWFINARRRILQPMLKTENKKIKIIQDKIIYSNYPLFDQSLGSNSKPDDSSNYIYTHRRFYHTNEEDSSNNGESSASSLMSTLPTKLSSMDISEDDEDLLEE